MHREVKNIDASVRDRLLNLARESGENFDVVRMRFVLERLLFRLGTSSYNRDFVLKGAMLLAVWSDNPLRGTRDVDLLGFGESSENVVLRKFRSIMSVACRDGVRFDLETMSAGPIAKSLSMAQSG